ncbi:hypothetical protein HHI36_013751, partial [Cryptolaemus montrouzieri]
MYSQFLIEHSVEISCIIEHWDPCGLLNRLSLGEYRIADSYSRQSSNHGGTAIIVRKGIDYLKLSQIEELSVENHIEMVTLKIPHENLNILCIYRPPSAVFREASRYTNTSETCIDNIFLNIDCSSYLSRTFDPHLSDHCVQE